MTSRQEDKHIICIWLDELIVLCPDALSWRPQDNWPKLLAQKWITDMRRQELTPRHSDGCLFNIALSQDSIHDVSQLGTAQGCLDSSWWPIWQCPASATYRLMDGVKCPISDNIVCCLWSLLLESQVVWMDTVFVVSRTGWQRCCWRQWRCSSTSRWYHRQRQEAWQTGGFMLDRQCEKVTCCEFYMGCFIFILTQNWTALPWAL